MHTTYKYILHIYKINSQFFGKHFAYFLNDTRTCVFVFYKLASASFVLSFVQMLQASVPFIASNLFTFA